MPITEPTFDTRKYRDILDEAVRRIPVHTPEWTNHSDSDPGITLLQLFAFMGESVIYRANRIPERNRRKFLRLLGVGLRPATAARGFVAFSRQQGLPETVTLGPGVALMAGSAPFRTERGLDVLPVEAVVFYKRRLEGAERQAAVEAYRELYASFESPAGDAESLDYYETRPLEPPRPGSLAEGLDVGAGTVDGLWLAIFARRADEVEAARAELRGKTLTLGILPSLEADGAIAEPERAAASGDSGALAVETPNFDAPADATPAYRPLPAAADADPLTGPALVEVALGDAPLSTWTGLEPLEEGAGGYPPDLGDDARAERLITWLRIRLRPDPDAVGGQVRFRVAWLGINAARVEQRAHVAAELLPQGTGAPDQQATLANRPVIAGSLRLRVNGVEWREIDDLLAAPPEVEAGAARRSPGAGPEAAQVYTLDRESGEIRFGTGLHGARPPRGAVIVASYDYGGGPAGMVGIGAIKSGALPAGLRVSNPVPTWGGAAGETVAEAERRIPSFLANRDRLVTRQDFADISRGTPGVEIGRVEALALLRPDQPRQPSPGVVTVMVVPRTDPLNPHAPSPDSLFLRAVCEHLAPRRVITTELHVRGPVYRDVWVSVGIDVVPGRAAAPVREAVKAEIARFLSALEGGFAGEGWPLGRPIDPMELLVRAAQTEGVARVTGLNFGDAAGPRASPMELVGLELPRLKGLAVITDGAPPPIDELKGDRPATGPGPRPTPVPVVPETC